MANALALHQRIALRVRQLRASHAISLDTLAARSGVSRSMISLIERARCSPTAVVLHKLAAGLSVPLPSLFDAPSEARTSRPVSRRSDQPTWKDPASGYIRRNLSPPGMPQSMRLVEVHFPPGRRVAFEAGERDVSAHQQIWMVEGKMNFTIGKTRHELATGDCLAMQLGLPMMFHNPTRKPARYIVVLASEIPAKRK